MCKKILLMLILASMPVISLVGCGNTVSNENFSGEVLENKEVVYKKYSVNGLEFELPEQWEIKQEKDGGLNATNLGDSSFSVLTNDVPSALFKDFCERHIIDVFENMAYTTLNSYKKNTYGSYSAYDYELETIIQGEKRAINPTVLYVNDSAIVFLLIPADDNYDYETIYSHLLSSLK